MKRRFGSLGLILAIMLCIPLTPVSAGVSHTPGIDTDTAINGLPNYLESQSHSFSNLLPAGTDIPNTVLNVGAVGTGVSDQVITVIEGSLHSLDATRASQARISDFDGDGKTDISIYRPSDGNWWIVRSDNGQVVNQWWGLSGDVPMPGYYDTDTVADVAIYRPSDGTWWIKPSNTSGTFYSQWWGLTGDEPVPGDYDGDGKTDIAIYRPSDGTWWIIQSSTGQVVNQWWGLSGDEPMPGDYDGDGKTDIAIYRPGNGTWWIRPSNTSGTFYSQWWGLTGDKPVPGDYDGDGITDIAIYRPGDGTWWIRPSNTSGTFYSQWWGKPGDLPIPNTKLPSARIVFTFDDGWWDTHEYALPIMQAAGFQGTAYVMRDATRDNENDVDGWPDMMDVSQLDDLYDAGWDISNHTTNHDDNGAGTTTARLADLETEYRKNQEWIISKGWTRGAYHACYPSGRFSNQLITILQGMGVLTGRSVIDGIQAIPVTDYFRIPVQYVESESSNVADVKASIDSAIDSGGTLVLMIHRVMPDIGDLVTTTDDFQSIVDYVELNSDSIAVMTMSEWYNYAHVYQSLMVGQYQISPAAAMFEPGFVQIEAELLADAKARAQ
jgi:peptidoglycan/xylan/chitin deacetylase (PgdA/CDA1 family)